ncbi:MAG: cell wall hydrolase, partial [Candidatus Nanopelagicales bacterium]
MPAPLVAAIVRGVASQGIKKGIAQGAKQFAKDKIKDVAKEKAKSFIKNKKDKDGGLVKKSDDGGSGGGFFGGGGSGGSGGGGGGGSLIKSKKIDVNKLSLISNEKNDGSDKKDQSKPFTGEELIQELNKIKDNLVKLKEISSNNLANSIKNNSLLRRQREKAKRDEKEEKLESNKKGSEKPKSTKGVKGPGFLDLIWGFISNVLLGSLVVFLLKHAPTIIKLFKDIAKGLQNPLYALKIGITTLTTLFPKQIKFLAKLTGKILGPPARLIGKLLLKASNVLGNLFKKAGTAIINLVKNPIKNLAKKILGQAGTQTAKNVGQFVSKKVAPAAANAAGKAAGAAGQALNVVKRLKFLSKALKNVHVVGALIGIGIDLALGERVDVAAAGAIGSALGSGIGLALGKGGALALTISTGGLGILAAPIIIGASTFIGGAVGDWIGKEIYKKMAGIQSSADKAAPVNAKQGGGGSNSTVAMARARGRSGQTPQAAPAVSASKLSAKTQENAEKNIFKDEKHLNVFSEIREKLKISSFVGELLQLGADMAIGEKVNKTRTDIAAQQIGSSIGRALSENELQVFGFNKKLIGPFSEELTKWAKGKIFKDLTSISFPSYDKAKEESSSGTQPGQPGDPNDPGSSAGPGAIVTGGTADFWAMAAVASLENSNPQGQADVAQVLYNRLASGKYTGKSIKELVIATNQFQPTREGDPKLWAAISDKQSAIAAVASHPRGRKNAASMVENAAANIKNPALQKSAAEFVGGRTDFSATGQYDPYPGAIGIVKRHGHDIGWFVGPGSIEYGKTNPGPARAPKLGDIVVSSTPSGGGGGSPDINRPTVAGSPTDGKNRKIFLHWSAGGYNTPFSAYHSIVLGSGKKVQNTPYDKDKSGHTAGGNTNSVGLAVAAAEGATENNLKTPPTAKQLDVMTSEAANLAKSWGWTPAKVDSNVKTHGEWERYAVPAGILPPPVQRWDLDKLSQSDRFGSGGPKLRDMIKSKMSAMGGGKGNGGAVKKHKASEFILGGGRTLTS